MVAMEECCFLCPRNCKVNRVDSVGFCGAPNNLVVAHADLHFGEEPFVVGTGGSGAVFFSHCNLKCAFCQNAELRDGKIGKKVTVARLVEIVKELEQKGASTINFVSGMHYADLVVEALEAYKPKVPVVWNTNAYEKVETIAKLSKYVDVFLPDLKFCSKELSARVATCPNYFEVATSAILEMKKQKPVDLFDKNGVLTSGVAVRHLALPNHTDDSKKIVDFLSKNLNGTILCLMSQYVPFDRAKDMPDLNRKLKPIEYNSVLHYAQQKLKGQIFAQDFSSATTDFIPKWNADNI